MYIALPIFMFIYLIVASIIAAIFWGGEDQQNTAGMAFIIIFWSMSLFSVRMSEGREFARATFRFSTEHIMEPVYTAMPSLIIATSIFSISSFMFIGAPKGTFPPADYWSQIWYTAVIPAIFEELSFRGIMQLKFEQKMSKRKKATATVGFIFSLFHLQFNPVSLLYRWWCGYTFGEAAARSGSLVPGMLAHFLNNALVVSIEFFHFTTDPLFWFLVAIMFLVDTAVFNKIFKKNTEYSELPVPVDSSGESSSSSSSSSSDPAEMVRYY